LENSPPWFSLPPFSKLCNSSLCPAGSFTTLFPPNFHFLFARECPRRRLAPPYFPSASPVVPRSLLFGDGFLERVLVAKIVLPPPGSGNPSLITPFHHGRLLGRFLQWSILFSFFLCLDLLLFLLPSQPLSFWVRLSTESIACTPFFFTCNPSAPPCGASYLRLMSYRFSTDGLARGDLFYVVCFWHHGLSPVPLGGRRWYPISQLTTPFGINLLSLFHEQSRDFPHFWPLFSHLTTHSPSWDVRMVHAAHCFGLFFWRGFFGLSRL